MAINNLPPGPFSVTITKTGTLLFVISDSILGWARFVRSEPWMPLAVMFTYHGAIGLLALSLW